MAISDFEISCCIAVFTGYCVKLKLWWAAHAVLLSLIYDVNDFPQKFRAPALCRKISLQVAHEIVLIGCFLSVPQYTQNSVGKIEGVLENSF